MNNRVFIAYSIESIAKSIGTICQKNGADVVFLKDETAFFQELTHQKFDALFIEFNYIEGQHRNIISQIRQHRGLEDLFIVVYAPTELTVEESRFVEGANATIKSPFKEEQLAQVFKRAFALPKQVLFITPNPKQELALALSQVGYDVKCCPSADEALANTNQMAPDFIIAEHKPPSMDAVAFRDQASSNGKLAAAPIVVAYDGRDANTIEVILKAGLNDIIISPFASAGNLKRIQDRFPLAARGRRLRALVVDDSPSIRSLIVTKFKELDYHVEVAENGFEGYKAVQRFNPDIITSDYDMPVLNGWQFCSEVRDHEQYKDIPIIMITTRASEIDLKKGELLGVSAYLTKPFTRDQLKEAVELAIANARIKREQDTIAKFVASDTLKAVNQMVDGGDANNGVDKFITVLFSDICAFSSKCERFSARKIVRLLNTYFDLMVEVLSSHNAIIDKFIGDAIVARFDSGNPQADARNAVFAAWRMQEKLAHFNQDAFEEIEIRVGINSGTVILGNLGSAKHRLEYAMIGDNVNLGQRLESSAPSQKCMISEATYELVKEHVHVGPRQEIKVKGKQDIVAAYVMEGIR